MLLEVNLICDLKLETFKKLEAVTKEHKDFKLVYNDLDAIETRYIAEALNCWLREDPRTKEKEDILLKKVSYGCLFE